MGLLEMSASGAVFILAVLVARAVFVNHLPKKTFLILWGLVLLRLLVPLRCASGLSVYSWMPQYMGKALPEISGVQQGQGQKEGMLQAGVYGEPNGQEASLQGKGAFWEIFSGIAVTESGTSEMEAMESGGMEVAASGDAGKSGFENFLSAFLFGTLRIPGLDGRIIRMLGIVWMLGFGICTLFFAVLYVRCRLGFRTAVLVKNEFALGWLSKHCGGRRVQIRQSGMVKAPLTYGLLRPVILMPQNTDWEDTRQLAYILAHESIHIKRLDAVTKLALAAALALHWFNPLVWVMYLLHNRDLELSCDETVVRAFGEGARAEYARILIHMEERKSRCRPLCSSFSKNATEERIMAIMKTRKKSIPAVIAAAVMVCVLTGVFATLPAESKEKEQVNALTQPVRTNGAGKEAGASQLVQANAESQPVDDKGTGKSQFAGDGGADGKGTDGSQFADDNGAEGQKSAGIQISNTSLYLDKGKAEEISEVLTAHIIKMYEGVYSFRNFEVTFYNEVVQDGGLSLDIEVGTDMALVRNPKDSPYAMGMRAAIEGIADARQKKAAKKIYREYLEEVMPYYMEPERSGFLYQVHLPAVGANGGTKDPGYELFFLSGSGEVGEPIQAEEHFTEIWSEEDGRAYILENM